MNLDDIGDYVAKTVAKYALISVNGTILKASLDETAILKIYPIVTEILNDVPPGNMYTKTPVIIFRVTENILLILLTQTQDSVISRMLEQFLTQFGPFLQKNYAVLPKNLRELVKFAIFSIARQSGPEPFGWISQREKVSEESIFKYSLASMMLLMNEIEGAHHRILNFHPFITERLMGMIYLFQVPSTSARGGAFDAAILVMSDYDERTILYQFHGQLERIFSITADDFIKTFNKNFQEDIQRPVQSNERPPFDSVLRDLLKRLQTISIGFKSTHMVKNEMVESIRSLSKLI